jgi:hypothetical protein
LRNACSKSATHRRKNASDNYRLFGGKSSSLLARCHETVAVQRAVSPPAKTIAS